MSKFRTAYGARCKRGEGTRQGVRCTEEENLTKSEFTEECDLNRFIQRVTGGRAVDLSSAAQGGLYGDFTPIDYMEAHNRVENARRAFMALPPELRAQVDNDPAKFLARIASQSKEDMDWKKEWKLLKEEPPSPAPAPAAGQAASPPAGS